MDGLNFYIIIKRYFISCIQNLHMVILAEDIIKVFVQRGIKEVQKTKTNDIKDSFKTFT